jgi:hypothetical protein
LTRAGAMRALAEHVSVSKPDLLALSEIDDGDALALATRFDLQWAYRGGQALLWNGRFTHANVYDSFLPAPPLQAFERRGLIRVDGHYDGNDLSLVASRFAADRSRARDLRFTRGVLRLARTPRMLLFITNPPAARSDAFRDLGFFVNQSNVAADVMLAARGCSVQSCIVVGGAYGIGTKLVAGVTV